MFSIFKKHKQSQYGSLSYKNKEHQDKGSHDVHDDAHRSHNHNHEHEHSHDAHEHNRGHCSHDHTPTIRDTTPLELTANQRFNWIIHGMDCPSCAGKIENAVKKLPEAKQVKVLFTTEKLVVDADSDIRAAVEQAVKKAGFEIKQTDSTTKLPPAANHWKTFSPILILIALMVISWGMTKINPPAGQIAFIVTTLIGLYPVATKAIKLIRSGTPFAIETLMSVAAIGALFIDATAEAAMVILLFKVGEVLESYAAGRARRGVSALMALVPEQALLVTGGEKKTVPAADLRPGDIIEIAPGARLPTDAELLSPFASFDESALTGESIPVERQQGEKVAAGCLSVDSAVQMRVISEPGHNAIDRILQLIEEAEERRAPIERFIDRFSRIYTPLIILFSVLVVVIPPLLLAEPWETWIYRGLTLLLIGCPCALVISTPAAITSALAAATRRGALIKGGAALEQLGSVTTIALDKTGTLTEGKPRVTEIEPVESISVETLLALAGAVESGSHHPLAKAILNAAENKGVTVVEAEHRKALAGIGVEGRLSGQKILVAAPGRLPENTLSTAWKQRVTELESSGKTAVAVVQGEQFVGLIAMQDTLRQDAIDAIRALKKQGVNAVMLTGDNPRAAAAIADQLGIDYRAGLLPEDKVKAVTELNEKHHTMMVGDGINDAPAMKAASIGVAMGSGTDVALETADAALTHNRLTGLPEMITLSRTTHYNIRQNITIALGLKAIFLITSLLGITGLWMAVLADSGATALVTANAIRLLRVKSQKR
ncbi:zinc/cadmium/mercury/lead-transporting ATPase [Xenorhabdus bovienii]|uniref:zinc/cadmium/mercury/lead-transporting ATPase n=1 Tax=Xenorhabdus bovienii TaxID=40576 RepID=UPI0023B22EB8|nr:zinc/cadmium/mercury/lead-transporting ATPase [Xenorhabdus bovienii]MDE9433975.1 zinc/cadmium/mercury/lead-transporting ATPase [Xenorhabdus bovienii]MDE9491601.1 zinc/cadmium/mercury/lead-transporting ATPase [Xenorhabdus bovienii]MDE9507894.1 zinc/cadmium/mercury/lead-transporting ATPase [Xenorhabdus bovienii]MDE9548839.1 zinc/cadmium/mercury/lead-transporting ATPase [Xenorhabdus bovienii]